MPPKKRRNAGAHRRKPAKWLFKGKRYLSIESTDPNSAAPDGASVDVLRGALGLRPGVYDWETREAVVAAQVRLGLEVTGTVAAEDWHAIVNPTRRGRRGRSA